MLCELEMTETLNPQRSTCAVTGKIEYSDYSVVRGRIFNASTPDRCAIVSVSEAGQIIDEISPSIFRWDLRAQDFGRGPQGFIYQVPARYLDGASHDLQFKLKETGRELENSPVNICYSPESRSVPFCTTSFAGNKVLVLSPHPDDESLSCGGTLALHRSNGDRVKIIFLTDGSKADFRSKYDLKTYIELREYESSLACSALGVNDFEFWRITDRLLATAEQETAHRLTELIFNYQPTLIYAPSPLEFHPDHKAAAAILWRAIQKSRFQTTIAFWEYNRPIIVNTLVDITQVIESKKEACGKYESQLANYPYLECALGLNRYRALTVSQSCTHAEGYFVLNSDEILSWPIEHFAFGQIFRENWQTHQLPLVSIIIRTKDRLQTLREALSSIAIQTYSNIEVVIVNDGGEDALSIVQEFEKYFYIKYESLAHSVGRSAAANVGLGIASGKYINFLDDDDLFYQRHIDKLVRFLEKTGELVAFSDCEMGRYEWSEKGCVLTEEKKLFLGFDFDRDRLYYANFIPMMTVMFARSLVEKTGLFDESLDYLEDWDFWLRMSDHADFHRLPGVTAEYRVFSDHSYDSEAWKMRIFKKYSGYWNLENLAKTTWPRIAPLQVENERLGKLLSENQKEQALLSTRLATTIEELEQAGHKLEVLQSELLGAHNEIARITGSRGWRFLAAYGRVKHRFLLPALRSLWLLRLRGRSMFKDISPNRGTSGSTTA